MARSRKIKRSRKKKSSSFLPESVQAFMARRVVDGIALVLFAAGVFVAASLLTYSSSDPSWNTASDREVEAIHNVAGVSGAWTADILLQGLGGGAFALVLALAMWGFRVFKRQTIRPFILRFVAVLVSAVLMSLALAQVPEEYWTHYPYLASTTGVLLLEQVTGLTKNFDIPYFSAMFGAICGVLSVSIFLYGAAVSRYEIASVWFRIKIAAFIVGGFFSSIVYGFFNWVRHYNETDFNDEPVHLGIMEKWQALKEERAEAREERRLAKEQRRLQKKEDALQRQAAEEEDEEEYEEDEEEEYEEDEYEEEDDEEEEEVQERRAPVVGSSQSIPVVAPQMSDKKSSKKGQDSAQQRFALSDVDGEWELPSISLIQEVPPEVGETTLDEEALRRNAELLRNVLEDFNIKGDVVSIHPGPVVTLYEFEPAPGTKTSKVISIADDIARSMSAVSVRCAVVPGRNVIGIELPNKTRQTVYMKEMLSSRMYEKTSAKLPLILGKDIGGQPILADLAKMPHLLVAGTTGSGKSVAVNTMIMSLLFRLSPEKCRFIMIDPKMLELSVYDDIPHLLTPVVTEPGKAVVALKWAVKEMEDRYRNMSKLGVRNIDGYNQRIREALKNDEQIMHKVQTGFDPDTGKPTFEDQAMELAELPYIVIIVDEFADLMLVAGKDVENAIQRLAQMARAAGLHLIMATQRPSVDVITGVVKANFPTRISFQVTSKIDSRTILGDGGAEQLLGMGDMLYMAPGGRITRVHGPFVSDEDVEKTTDYLREQGAPSYIDDVTSEDGDFGGSEVMNAMFGGGDSSDQVDELYDQAVAVIAREGKVSTSFIQRHLQIGYNRAARIVEEMERQGVISAASPTGKRQILISDHSAA